MSREEERERDNQGKDRLNRWNQLITLFPSVLFISKEAGILLNDGESLSAHIRLHVVVDVARKSRRGLHTQRYVCLSLSVLLCHYFSVTTYRGNRERDRESGK
jgi:hypothetical protein